MNTNRSIVSPLIIDAVAVPGTAGLIGMTICPGKDEYAGMGVPSGPWKRDLDLDLQVIRDWQAQALVTLIEEFEFELLSVPELPERARAFGLRWFHLPIVDVWVPDLMFEEEWERAGEELRQILRQDGRSCSTVGEGSGGPGPLRRGCWWNSAWIRVRQFVGCGLRGRGLFRPGSRRSMC